MVLYPNKLPESERVCSGICNYMLTYTFEENFLNFHRLEVLLFLIGVLELILYSFRSYLL